MLAKLCICSSLSWLLCSSLLALASILSVGARPASPSPPRTSVLLPVGWTRTGVCPGSFAPPPAALSWSLSWPSQERWAWWRPRLPGLRWWCLQGRTKRRRRRPTSC
jgi:hypothetical protein